MVVGFFVTKCSRRTKVEMVVVKVKKATAKKTCKAKKLNKLAAVAKLGSAKKLSKTLKGEMEKASRPLNPESGEIGASTWKESCKREASKDNIQVVKQFWSSFDSLESSKEEKKNLEAVNIPKDAIKASMWTEECKRAQEALEAQAAQEAQVAKEAREGKL